MRRTSRPPAAFGRLLTAAWLCASASASAQQVDCDSADHRRGLALGQQGQHEQAYEHFRALAAREGSGCALARMGMALGQLQRWVDAERALAQALERTQDAWVAQYRGRLEDTLRDVRGHLAQVVVSVPPDVPDAELWIGDARIGTLPLARGVWLAPGSVSFEIRAAGHQPEQRTVTIAGPGVYHETMTFHRAEPTEPAPPTRAASEPAPPTRAAQTASPAPVASDRPQLVPAVVSFGVAGALAIASGVLVAGAEQRYGEYLACATEAAGAESTCPERRADAGDLRRWSIGGFGLAGAAVVTGVVVLLVGRTRPASRPSATPRAEVPCLPSLAGLGLVCGGRF